MPPKDLPPRPERGTAGAGMVTKSTLRSRGVWRGAGAAATLSILLAGCSKPYEEINDQPCPPGGTTLRYQTFGAPFMSAYCSSCHGADALDRMGAPGDFIFDTAAQIERHRDRIFVRSAAGNDSMPPGPQDPPRDQRDQLAEWLRCGAP